MRYNRSTDEIVNESRELIERSRELRERSRLGMMQCADIMNRSDNLSRYATEVLKHLDEPDKE